MIVRRRLLAFVLASFVVACRTEKTEAPQDAAASATTTPSASAPFASANSSPSDAATDASLALANAVSAGSREWRVLVPKSVPDATADAARNAIVRAVSREVTAARADHADPSRVVIYADTTIDYGCLCPPFVFAPFWNSGRSDGTFLPIYATDVPEPPLAKQGLYRVLGHFDGRRITGYDWLKMRSEKIEEGMDEYAKTAPVFIVEDWCFEPNDMFSDPGQQRAYLPTILKMEKQGRLCPGAHMPVRIPRDK